MLNAKEFHDEMVSLVTNLIPDISGDFRAPGCEDDDVPSMQLTVGAQSDNEREGWSFQTGDNSYTGGAYSFPFWAVVTLDNDSNPEDVANDIMRQLIDNENFNFDVAE
jgi:hypothetical protein